MKGLKYLQFSITSVDENMQTNEFQVKENILEGGKETNNRL